MIISVIWFFVGLQDKALVSIYRAAVEDMAKRIASFEWLEWYKDYSVGSKKQFLKGVKYNEKFTLKNEKLVLFFHVVRNLKNILANSLGKL